MGKCLTATLGHHLRWKSSLWSVTVKQAPAKMAIFGLDQRSALGGYLWVLQHSVDLDAISPCSGSGSHSGRWQVWSVKVDVGKAQDLQTNPWFMGSSILHSTALDLVIRVSPSNPTPETWTYAETVNFMFWADKWWWLLLELWHFLSRKITLFGGRAGEGQLLTFSVALLWLWGRGDLSLSCCCSAPKKPNLTNLPVKIRS